MMWWNGLSVMGSLAVTGPVGLAIAVWLLAGKSWRLTLGWIMLFGLGMAMVVLTKVAFIGWGLGLRSIDFAGISGHAMRAAAVYPVAAFLAARSSPSTPRRLALAVGVILSALIAVARVKVDTHSASEAISGCLLGLAVAAAFIWMARSEDHLPLSRMLVLLCSPVLLVAPRVEPMPTELWMTELALYLSGHQQPYTRGAWRAQPQAHARVFSLI
jgi:membrane-associated phospholipid phosphatase